MEGGTDALAKAVEVAPPAETERQPYDEFDIEVIRATQGDMPVVPEPYAPAADELGIPQEQLLDAPARRCRSGGCSAASPRSCSTAAPASAPTGWACGRCPTSGSWRSARGWRRSAGSRTATSARPTQDWPYSVFTMAHGRSKEECDAILDSIASETGITERATLYSSTEFKKIRLLYFTDEHRAWEREHAGV